MSTEMTIRRRLVRSDNRDVRTAETTYWVNGAEITFREACLWAMGVWEPTATAPAAPPEPTLMPGLHLIAPEEVGLPHWHLVEGYPLGTAADASQIKADTGQQPQYISTTDDKHYVVIPNPNSAHRMDQR